MSILLEQKQALVAGDGQLPVRMAENATKNGLEVICISLSNDNVKDLKKVCSKVYSVGAGELLKIKKILQDVRLQNQRHQLKPQFLHHQYYYNLSICRHSYFLL